MEFGIFVQAHLPRQRVEAVGPDAEHEALLNEIDLVKVADQHGWKYAWCTEHHFLTEYSHLSANEVYLGYLAAVTENIHIGSGIFNVNPQVNHPVRVAERVAMLDHLSEGRFEFGTGRGAGSREVTGFDIPNTDATKAVFAEVIGEYKKMWRDEEYSYDGPSFRVPHPDSQWPTRNVLPKPWKKPHPPMWRAAGNPPTYAEAARQGLGVLGFNVASIKDMEAPVQAYKDNIANAEPVGEYANDNVMITNGVVCLEDGKRAREVATRMGISYLQTLVFYYHDTFPKQEGFPVWPEPAAEPTLDEIEWRINEGFPVWPEPAAEPTLDEIEWRINEGYLLCGDPDEVTEQVRRYESVGADQICFGMPLNLSWADAEETIRLVGDHVIPQIDKDPVHRTTRFRDEAAAKL